MRVRWRSLEIQNRVWDALIAMERENMRKKETDRESSPEDG